MCISLESADTERNDLADNWVGLNDFVREVGENMEAHGFGETCTKVSDYVAWLHSEVSEIYEEYRAGHTVRESYYGEDGKPMGIPSEIADVIILACSLAYRGGIDLEKAIMEKHEYNKTRPYLHGKEC